MWWSVRSHSSRLYRSCLVFLQVIFHTSRKVLVAPCGWCFFGAIMEFANNGMLLYGRHEPLNRDAVLRSCMGQHAPFAKFVPKEPSPNEALRRAMVSTAKVYTTKCAETDLPSNVRALQQCGTFEAVQRRKGTVQNKQVHMFSAGLKEVTRPVDTGRSIRVPSPSETVQVIEILQFSRQLCQHELKGKLTAAYEFERNRLSHGQVSHLCKRVISDLGGVAMEGFNVWFAQAAAGQQFLDWAYLVGLSQFHGSSFSLSANPQTVRDVLTALEREVTDELKVLNETVSGDGLTPRKARHAAKSARFLLEKIQSYETAVGQPLEWLSDNVKSLQERLAVANLIAVSA